MPTDEKRQLRAARTNILLIRYIFVIAIAFGFLVLVLTGSYLLLTQTKNSAQQLIDANDTKSDVYSDTKAQIDVLSGNLTEARGILDQEIRYSKVLTNIAQQMPEGTVIEEVNLNEASFNGTPITFNVYAKTTDAAVILRERFQGSPFFSNVNFQSISDNTGGIDGYPVSVQLTLTLNRTVAQ